MHGNDEMWDRGIAEIEYGRFLEYTNQSLAERLKQLTDGVIQELISYPALFAYETPQARAARLGWITRISRRQQGLEIQFTMDARFNPVEPETMQRLLRDLDIDTKFEIHRSHWAVKEVDLEKVLTNAGLLASSRSSEALDYKFSRQTILKACTMLKTLSHADFDEFVLELGIDALDAGRGRGSRQSRAVALGEHAVKNSDQPTVDGTPLGLAIVRRAAQVDADYPEGILFDVDDRTRREFWQALSDDGLAFSEGHIARKTEAGSGQTAAPRDARVAGGSTLPAAPRISSPNSLSTPKIFIVHGREDAAKLEVARFIERLGLEAVILHEQPNGGKTLLAKFMDAAAEVSFAVVLMTPDDVGGLATGTLSPRSRQNVIFELGFFIGKLGANKVCALVAGEVEKPSDFEAVVYVPYGPQTSWKAELARELRHAGISFDPHKVF